MKRNVKILVVLTIVSGSCLLFAFSGPGERYFDIARNLDIFATLFKEVNVSYVDEVDPKKLIHTGIDGMLETLDPYTDYIPEERAEAFNILTTGQYAGIGALIGVIDKKTVVTEPYMGFPAQMAGIRVGDELISIDGKNVQGKGTLETSALLKGKPKTPVEVVVRRAGQKKDLHFTITREKIKISNVVYQGMVSNEVGLIKLTDFTTDASKEVSAAFINLKAKGARKIILDLRDNPGGLLYEAVNIANLFIPKGKEVVSTRGKVQEWNKTYVTLNQPADLEIPLAVLTSSGSASASEIVAGSLQDYDRAILVGQRTFGKGLVQSTRQLVYNAQLKVTTAKYYIPSGRCIQALDYSHRKKDGTVDKFADSTRREFKTASGRKVFDGAGLEPDLPVADEYLGTAASQLVASGLIFEYASQYCGEHPDAPKSFQGFQLSDAEYNKFVAWLKGKNFTYTSELEKQADNLVNAAKNERIYSELQDQLVLLKAKIEQNHATDFIRFKSEIRQLLVQQIAFHYRLTEGQMEVSLGFDPEIQAALKALADQDAFRKLLLPH